MSGVSKATSDELYSKALEDLKICGVFIDSPLIPVCHNLMEKKHKTFKGLAAKGSLNRLLLWIQVPHDFQLEGRDYLAHHYPW